jgi:hypothetical protein
METAKENRIAMLAALMMVAGLIVFIMNRPPRPDPLDVNKVERALCMADILVPAPSKPEVRARAVIDELRRPPDDVPLSSLCRQ